jgi:hypothetical protein
MLKKRDEIEGLLHAFLTSALGAAKKSMIGVAADAYDADIYTMRPDGVHLK